MADFLLIHGSCHGAWCWRDTLPFLNIPGHSATAIDLPGHGDDRTPLAEVTLDLYAKAILAAAARIGRPVTLVGHSMAGYPITAAAERAPQAFARLIYLCAYLPRAGHSLIDMRRAGPSQPLLPAIQIAPDGHSFTFRPDMARDLFYHDCPTDTLAYALPRLCPQAVVPQATPLTPDRALRVEAHYIRCTEDRAIPPDYQATMSAHLPAGRVTTLPTSHSPFFAAPEALAQRLIDIAR
ncbi:MAG: alpha/beta fold hydrolase [Gemmobacter sp.]